jgi:hypothetical protein
MQTKVHSDNSFGQEELNNREPWIASHGLAARFSNYWYEPDAIDANLSKDLDITFLTLIRHILCGALPFTYI